MFTLKLGERMEPASATIGGSMFTLCYAGEIRFGPCYCTLTVGGVDLQDRLFGDLALISDSGRYVLAQQWYTIREQDGPHVGVLLLDLRQRREATLLVRRSFSGLRSLDDTIAVYRHSGALETVTHIDRVDTWKALSWK